MQRKVILNILLIFSTLVCASNAYAQIINIDAGNPTTLCYGENLDLSILDAYINGDVDDGNWFTMGDGIFLPSNASTGVFSTSTTYVPGPDDQLAGEFTLILVSDDPDGNGPMVEVVDNVTITFVSTPPLVCNTAINVSLGINCTETVDVFMTVANPIAPFDRYLVSLFDSDNNPIPDELLTAEHLGAPVTFVVGHNCSPTSCSGSITVQDYVAPVLVCRDTMLACNIEPLPLTAGLPIPSTASAQSTGNNNYIVTNLDACSDVTLSYSEDVVNFTSCSNGVVQEITRSWFATDESGNNGFCQQVITIASGNILDINPIFNYNDVDLPALTCNGNWIALANGNPSPETTGTPNIEGCDNIETSYTDVNFDLCGSGFKVVRQWFVIDWCLTETRNINQIISIADHQAPDVTCGDDITISTGPYTCVSDLEAIAFDGVVEDCSEWDRSLKLFNTIGQEITTFFVQDTAIDNLPKGTYQLQHVITDACGNVGSCVVSLTVIDDVVPYPICEEFTNVTLSTDGFGRVFATSLDEASYDNCEIDHFEVAKMTDECNFGLQFGPYVDFCCQESGDSLLVALKVTDIEGLSNTCMVTVFVEEKLPPEITCPTNLSITCQDNFDLSDLDIFGEVQLDEAQVEDIILNGVVVGQDGFLKEHCGATVTETSDIDQYCGEGEITRTFVATDNIGQSVSCVQTITIENIDLFTENDINWPGNYQMDGCDTVQADVNITGLPTFNDDFCSLVEFTYEDQFFSIVDSFCVKILRRWTVIDWCQYDFSTGEGEWSYYQEIKMTNSVAPTFVDCSNQMVCNVSSDCDIDEVVFGISATDDCTSEDQLIFNWEVDTDNNGSIDGTGSGDTAMFFLNFGEHKAIWTVEDKCGNTSSCEQLLMVEDCKNPTPYCLSGVSTTVMPTTGTLEIWAKDFDISSTDNCTAAEDLLFSFSTNPADSNLVVTCDSIPNGVAAVLSLKMYVHDEAGNSEACDVQLRIMDTDDVCEDQSGGAMIAGSLETMDGYPVANAEVRYRANVLNMEEMQLSDSEGEYVFSPPAYLDYSVTASKQAAAKQGVSTSDLVQIQRHILQLAPFDSPYKIIASDVTQNGKLTVADLLTIRKIILGVYVDWPNADESIIFVDKHFQFQDPMTPFPYADSIVISNLSDTMDFADFIAVKLGDVNGSFDGLLAEEKATVRTANPIELQYRYNERTKRYDFFVADERELYGLQLKVEGEDLRFESEFLRPDEFYAQTNTAAIALALPEGRIFNGDVLFSVANPNVHFARDFENMAIDLDQHYEVARATTTENEISSTVPQLTVPTFLQNQLVIHNEGAEAKANIRLVDVNGNLVINSKVRLSVGSNTFDCRNLTVGSYFLTVQLEGMPKQNFKLMKIN